MGNSVRMQGVDSIKFDTNPETNKPIGLGIDRRPWKVKYAFFFETVQPALLSVLALFFAVVLPMFTELFLVISALSAFWWGKARQRFINKQMTLFDKPKYLNYTTEAALADYSPKENESDIEKLAPNMGTAVYFMGHEISTNQEVHLDDNKFRTHLIIFGTTGSGKTENILSLCVNFLTQASGFILVDGKGDTLLLAKTFAICRAYNRTDDLYLLNFMDKGGSEDEKTIEINTNTFNFLVDSTAREADEIIGGLLPSDEGGGSGMWEGRAASGINSINQAVYYLKDNGYLEIDPDTYRTYFGLEEFVELACNDAIPKPKRTGLWQVLKSINYKFPTAADPNPKQNPATEEQFQYITMQYTETFGMLADQYKHITVSQVPEISITDVVLRRRILLVLLPSLAKSPQSVRNLGRIIIAMTRNVSSKAIGAVVEGDYKRVIESKPTAAISSFGLIFDEFGTYATKGASTLPAQVRSLNMVCVFAGQDYEAFKRGDEMEAATIFANCTIKICMKLECNLTYEKFKESAGEEYIMVQESYESKETMFGRKYREAETARVEKRPTLEMKDLKGQGSGEETLIYGATTHRVLAFYANPIMPPTVRLNHMLEVRRPGFSDIQAMRKGVDAVYTNFQKRLKGDWEKDEATMKRLFLSFANFYDEIGKINEQVKHSLDKHPEVDEPSETELAIFTASAYLKKVELVDKSVKKAAHDVIGAEMDDGFDDDDLLGGDDLFAVEDKSGDTSSMIQPVIPQQSPEPVKVPRDTAAPAEAAEAMPESAPERHVQDKREKQALDHALMSRVEGIIAKKNQRLSVAVQSSFNSLESVNMSIFDTQQRLQTLEEALMIRDGASEQQAKGMSDMTAKNMVVEMGLRTNVAVVTEKEKNSTSPSRSKSEVQRLLADAIGKG
jgi:hypothetical protein